MGRPLIENFGLPLLFDGEYAPGPGRTSDAFFSGRDAIVKAGAPDLTAGEYAPGPGREDSEGEEELPSFFGLPEIENAGEPFPIVDGAEYDPGPGLSSLARADEAEDDDPAAEPSDFGLPLIENFGAPDGFIGSYAPGPGVKSAPPKREEEPVRLLIVKDGLPDRFDGE